MELSPSVEATAQPSGWTRQIGRLALPNDDDVKAPSPEISPGLFVPLHVASEFGSPEPDVRARRRGLRAAAVSVPVARPGRQVEADRRKISPQRESWISQGPLSDAGSRGGAGRSRYRFPSRLLISRTPASLPARTTREFRPAQDPRTSPRSPSPPARPWPSARPRRDPAFPPPPPCRYPRNRRA